MSLNLAPQRQPVRGFTLIEVLISLAILAVGLLGVTAMQTESLKYNSAALYDSQAQFLLNDMMERIRANGTSNLYVMTFIQPPDPAPVNCGSVSANCNSNQMALWDMNQWLTQVRELLPDGQGQILFNPLNRTYVISIRYRWDQIGGAEDVINDQRVLTITSM